MDERESHVKDLKIAGWTQRVPALAEEYETKVMDLKVEITLLVEALQALQVENSELKERLAELSEVDKEVEATEPDAD